MNDAVCATCGATIKASGRGRPGRKEFCGSRCRRAWLKSNKLGAYKYAATRETEFSATGSVVVHTWFDPGSLDAIKRAIDAGDTEAVFEGLRRRCIMDDGCWIWNGRTKKGYPQMSLCGRRIQVHRLSLETKLGKTLGTQAAHHMCAHPSCINPDHLQPVTAVENNAEMMARTYMVRRISDLEEALRSIDPNHPSLNEVSISRCG